MEFGSLHGPELLATLVADHRLGVTGLQLINLGLCGRIVIFLPIIVLDVFERLVLVLL